VADLRFDGVLTTNLYGLPDDVIALADLCAERGVPLIEDAAHALQTTVAGAPVGTYGAAGLFSLSTYAGAAQGGAIALASPDDRAPLEELRERWLSPRYPVAELTGLLKAATRNTVTGTRLPHQAWLLAEALGLNERRDGGRIPLRRNALASRLAGVPYAGMVVLDPWVRADNPTYRMRQGGLAERYALRRLRAAEAQRGRRLRGVLRLAGLKTAASAVRDHLDQPLFRVPLMVQDRDRAIEELRRLGVMTGHIYDPPFDDYAPGLAEPSPSPEAARWWARHVLPVDPLLADRAWPILAALSPPREGAP
jgi:dTDP-4-amino-4,6-dideoxygalactose transaminase